MFRTIAADNHVQIGRVRMDHIELVSQEQVVVHCNNTFDFDEDYRFGFNGQHKDNEIAGIGNHNTALFGELETRLGRRWNLDPKPDASSSPYSVFGNSPILMSDVLLDTPRIYGNAEVTGTTLHDKGGTIESVDRNAGAHKYRDLKLNPRYSNDGKLVGYYVYDKPNSVYNGPILQLEPGDLQNFRDNYSSMLAGARAYYTYGEPTEGYEKMSAGIETSNAKLFAEGLKQSWSEAVRDPMFYYGLAAGSAQAALHATGRSMLCAIISA